MCIILGEKEDADVEILRLAALFHDTGRIEELKTAKDHSLVSMEIAKEFLSKKGLSGDKINRILYCIRSHRFKTKIEPKTLEAKILADADKLDAMGVIGLVRTAIYSGEIKRDIKGIIEHINNKLLLLKDLIKTASAKKIAEHRRNILKNILDELLLELQNKDIELY